MTQLIRRAIVVCAILCTYLVIHQSAAAANEPVYCSGVTVSALQKDMRRQPVCNAALAVESILGGTLGGTHVFIVEMDPRIVKSFPKLAQVWNSASFEASIVKLAQQSDRVFNGKSFDGHIIQIVPQRTNWLTTALAAHELMHEQYNRMGKSPNNHRHHCDMFFGNMHYKQVLDVLAPLYGATEKHIAYQLEEQRSQFHNYCDPTP